MSGQALKFINPNAEATSRAHALMISVSASRGMQELLKTNLGPRGTLKMLVGGAGQIKLSKDGATVMSEMQLQQPTAIMIARTATAMDEQTGDGTTAVVLVVGELLRQAERAIAEGLHPRTVCDGFELARDRALAFLDTFRINKPNIVEDRETLFRVAQSALRTKLAADLADQMSELVVDAVLTIRRPDMPIDLHMVERMHMVHRTSRESRLVKGLVLDHGSRHPDTPSYVENAFILTANVSLEYEKSEVNATFVFSNAAERERLVEAERRFVDERVRKIIELKRQVCTEENKYNFVVINQKGIDPLSLDMFAKEGIIGLRRAKRRNMERLVLACGGVAVNSVDELSPDVLGFAGKVYEQTLGEEKFTIVEDVKNPFSCTILLKGPNPHTIAQLQDAVRDGLRVVKNAIEDGCVVPGAGAFEIAAAADLDEWKKTGVKGKAKLGVTAFAEALQIIPKTLAENSGFDVPDTLIKVQEEYAATHLPVGINVTTGEPLSPEAAACQLLLVDEVMRAGRGSRGAPPE